MKPKRLKELKVKQAAVRDPDLNRKVDQDWFAVHNPHELDKELKEVDELARKLGSRSRAKG